MERIHMGVHRNLIGSMPRGIRAVIKAKRGKKRKKIQAQKLVHQLRVIVNLVLNQQVRRMFWYLVQTKT